MKKQLLGLVLGTTLTGAFADSFQDFNNNAYISYQNNAIGNALTVNQWGVGGTLQANNNFWAQAQTVSGLNLDSSTSLSSTDLKAGYAFQFFNEQSNGFQLIPYASFSYLQSGGPGVNGTSYLYGIGVRPEYRLLDALKLSLDLGIGGVQNQLGSTVSAYNNNGSAFSYTVSPEIQYNISKTVFLGAAYSYTNSFNSQGLAGSNSGQGTNVVTGKFGYLF